MLSLLGALRTHRDLLFMLAWRDIRIKYKQSVMGFMWALLMPLLIVSAGLVVKLAFAQVSGKPLRLSQLATVALKALPWSFFIASLRFATISLTANMTLVTKIAFPRVVFPLSATLSQAFDFMVASVVVTVILTIAQVGVSIHLLWVPLLLVLLLTQTVGLALLFSAANLFYRDIKYIVEVIITFAIFFTPVFYEAEMFGPWGNLLMLNPVAPILEALNDCVVGHHAPALLWTLYSAAVAAVLITVAPFVFHQLEPKFAESI